MPSGRRVRVDVAARGTPRDDDRFRGEALAIGGRLLAALDEGALSVREDDDGGARALTPEDLGPWPLRDFHALRDVAARLGVIADRTDDLTCRNCDAALDGDPRRAPTRDLDDWYAPGRLGVEDVPFAAGPGDVPLPLPVRHPGGRAARLTVAPVTVAEARPLWRALAKSDTPPATAAVVRALGVRALGSLRTPRRIARALEDAPEDVWRVLEAAFLLASYAPEGVRPVACSRCGAVHDVDAPAEREVPVDGPAEAFVLGDARALSAGEGGDAAFPAPDAFEALVERIADEVFAEMGVRNLELRVDDGTPPVDGAGEPLMASYRPVDVAQELGLAGTGASDLRFRVEVYPRTFEKMFAEAPYDVEAELRDTLEHEVEHHLHHLRGHDPMDEAEREEALRDLERTYGRRYVAAARRRAAADELLGFLRFAVPILLLVAAVAAVVGLLAGR